MAKRTLRIWVDEDLYKYLLTLSGSYSDAVAICVRFHKKIYEGSWMWREWILKVAGKKNKIFARKIIDWFMPIK